MGGNRHAPAVGGSHYFGGIEFESAGPSFGRLLRGSVFPFDIDCQVIPLI